MTREEIKTLIMAIKSAYPNFNPENMKNTIDIWTLMLDDMDFKVMTIALKSYIRTSETPFAPSISELMKEATKITGTNQLDSSTAWDLVSKAIRNSSYNSKEEFEKLPETVQKALGSAERLRNMAIDEKFNEGVESSNFYKAYSSIVKRENDFQKLSADVQKILLEKQDIFDKSLKLLSNN